MKIFTFFCNALVVTLDLKLFDKLKLIFLQTIVTVILEGNNIRTNSGAFVGAV
jgi:hypothetical protein